MFSIGIGIFSVQIDLRTLGYSAPQDLDVGVRTKPNFYLDLLVFLTKESPRTWSGFQVEWEPT